MLFGTVQDFGYLIEAEPRSALAQAVMVPLISAVDVQVTFGQPNGAGNARRPSAADERRSVQSIVAG
jgi:hypothetical protein